MQTIKDLSDALDNIAAAMMEKGITVPRPEITHYHGGRVQVWLHADGLIGGETCVQFCGGRAEEVIAKVLSYISDLPSTEEKAAHDFATKLAHVIDFGRDSGIDEEYITPLRTTRAALTENLLTHSG